MKKWYVLNTRPKKESQVEKLFQEGGFEIYNPKYIHEKKVKPFFNGYEFINFEYPEQYRTVKYTRGVKKVVGNGDQAVPIPYEIIKEIKAREVNGYIELEKYGEEPNTGDEIEVMEGPFKGFKGIFKKELSQQQRVLVLLNYITYQGRIVIEKKKIKKIL